MNKPERQRKARGDAERALRDLLRARANLRTADGLGGIITAAADRHSAYRLVVWSATRAQHLGCPTLTVKGTDHTLAEVVDDLGQPARDRYGYPDHKRPPRQLKDLPDAVTPTAEGLAEMWALASADVRAETQAAWSAILPEGTPRRYDGQAWQPASDAEMLTAVLALANPRRSGQGLTTDATPMLLGVMARLAGAGAEHPLLTETGCLCAHLAWKQQQRHWIEHPLRPLIACRIDMATGAPHDTQALVPRLLERTAVTCVRKGRQQLLLAAPPQPPSQQLTLLTAPEHHGLIPWIYDPDPLRAHSRGHGTGAPIPWRLAIDLLATIPYDDRKPGTAVALPPVTLGEICHRLRPHAPYLSRAITSWPRIHDALTVIGQITAATIPDPATGLAAKVPILHPMAYPTRSETSSAARILLGVTIPHGAQVGGPIIDLDRLRRLGERHPVEWRLLLAAKLRGDRLGRHKRNKLIDPHDLARLTYGPRHDTDSRTTRANHIKRALHAAGTLADAGDITVMADDGTRYGAARARSGAALAQLNTGRRSHVWRLAIA